MKIYVGNLPFSMGEAELKALFAEYGEVDNVNVITDRETNRSRGFGFVEMVETETAQTAISSLSGREIDGRRLNVNEARPKRSGGGGGGGGRGGRW